MIGRAVLAAPPAVAIGLTFGVVGISVAQTPVLPGPSATHGTNLAICADPVAAAVGRLGQRTYVTDQSGYNAIHSRYRIAESKALGDAVARGDSVATTGILRRLLYRQIARIRVYRGALLLAEVGHSPALAPVYGRLRDARGHAVGRFVLSTQTDRDFAALTGDPSAAKVLIRTGRPGRVNHLHRDRAPIPDRGTVAYHGSTYHAFSFSGRSLTGDPVRISYLIGPAGVARECGPTRETTILNVVAGVSVGIYMRELISPETRVRRDVIAHAHDMLAGVRHRSPVAVRAAIVRLFRTSLHIVRVRVTAANGRLINDVGGPAVLAPVGGVFRSPGGRVVGHFLFSLQDDAGYLKLVRAFSGAKVLMRVGARQVAGTLNPGPRAPPDYGPVRYRGIIYYCYTFTATAFPRRPLRISILIRPRDYA